MKGQPCRNGRNVLSNALFAYEAEILDLHDAGLSAEEIGARTGRDAERCRKIITLYCGRTEAERSFEAKARRGSAALLAAILARPALQQGEG